MFYVRRDMLSIMLRVGIVVLALSTSYIHFQLGGAMFIANAVGYLVFAAAMSVPLQIASRHRWLIRAALLLFALATIAGWLMFGARYWLGYVDKAIEVALIGLVLWEMFRYDGGPLAVARRAYGLGMRVMRRLTGGNAA